MADVKWIKIVTDIFDDEKMLLIESLPSADSIIVIWFKLLCLAGKNNNNGVFLMNDRIAYTDEMLATIFRRDINTVRLALKTFEAYGMIEIIDGVYTIPNWGKHQTLDSYEKKKERDKQYQAERRRKQKEIAEKSSDKSTDTSSEKSSDVAISDIEEDIDKDIEEDKEVEREKDIKEVSKDTSSTEPDKPPTVDEKEIISLLLVDKTYFKVYQKDLDEWKDSFPAVDIMQELKKMRLWCIDHPTNRKTKRGIRRFISGWLSREQDKYHKSDNSSKDFNVEDWANE